MSIIMQINPFEFFVDASGDALDSGYIYIGEINKDPRQYPVAVFYDVALTIPAALPLRTSGGYVIRNGAPTFLYINGNYSIRVEDKKHRQVYYVADFLMTGSQAAISFADLANTTDAAKGDALIGVKVPYPGSRARTQHEKNHEVISALDFAIGDGVTDDTAALALAVTYVKSLNRSVTLTFPGTFYIPGAVLLDGVGITYDMRGGTFLGQIGSATTGGGIVFTRGSNNTYIGGRIKSRYGVGTPGGSGQDNCISVGGINQVFIGIVADMTLGGWRGFDFQTRPSLGAMNNIVMSDCIALGGENGLDFITEDASDLVFNVQVSNFTSIGARNAVNMTTGNNAFNNSIVNINGLTIIDCTGIGIKAKRLAGCTISNVSIHNPGYRGVEIQQISDSQLSNITIISDGTPATPAWETGTPTGAYIFESGTETGVLQMSNIIIAGAFLNGIVADRRQTVWSNIHIRGATGAPIVTLNDKTQVFSSVTLDGNGAALAAARSREVWLDVIDVTSDTITPVRNAPRLANLDMVRYEGDRVSTNSRNWGNRSTGTSWQVLRSVDAVTAPTLASMTVSFNDNVNFAGNVSVATGTAFRVNNLDALSLTNLWLTSPDLTRWKASISNAGVLTWVAV